MAVIALAVTFLLSNLCLYRSASLQRLSVWMVADSSLKSRTVGFLTCEQMLAMLGQLLCGCPICRAVTLPTGETLPVIIEVGPRKCVGLTTADLSWMRCSQSSYFTTTTLH